MHLHSSDKGSLAYALFFLFLFLLSRTISSYTLVHEVHLRSFMDFRRILLVLFYVYLQTETEEGGGGREREREREGERFLMSGRVGDTEREYAAYVTYV